MLGPAVRGRLLDQGEKVGVLLPQGVPLEGREQGVPLEGREQQSILTASTVVNSTEADLMQLL